MDPLRLLRPLIAANVHVVLIGGLAAVLHGVPVVTNDIDLCYDSSPENRQTLVSTLAPLHPALRVARLSPEAARHVPFIWDERTLHDSPILTLITDAGDLDLLNHVPGLGNYEAVLAASRRITIDGLDIPVLDLDGLIAAKRAAGRPKDLMALPHIEATLLRRNEQRDE